MNNAEDSRLPDNGQPAVTAGSGSGSHDNDGASGETPAAPDNDMRCVICLDAVSDACIAQPCGHRHFDFLCLVSWLLHRRPSCPLCKAIVTTVQYSFASTADGQCKTFAVPQEAEETEDREVGETASAAPSSSASAHASAAATRRRRRDHHHGSRDAPSAPSSSSPEALNRRRRVYRLGLYSLHVGANRHSRYYRELTPRMFSQDPDLVSRARAFIRRELIVLLPGDGGRDSDGNDGNDGSAAPSTTTNPAMSAASRRLSTREFLLEYVVAILKTMDTQGSAGQAEELLRDFLGRDRARLFLHELRSWLRSPYLTLESWDRHVQYGAPEKNWKSWSGRRPGAEHGGTSSEPHNDNGDANTRRRKHSLDARQRSRRADCWRPAGDQDGDRRQAARSGGQRHRRRSSEATLQEACRRYDPS